MDFMITSLFQTGLLILQRGKSHEFSQYQLMPDAPVEIKRILGVEVFIREDGKKEEG